MSEDDIVTRTPLVVEGDGVNLILPLTDTETKAFSPHELVGVSAEDPDRFMKRDGTPWGPVARIISAFGRKKANASPKNAKKEPEVYETHDDGLPRLQGVSLEEQRVIIGQGPVKAWDTPVKPDARLVTPSFNSKTRSPSLIPPEAAPYVGMTPEELKSARTDLARDFYEQMQGGEKPSKELSLRLNAVTEMLQRQKPPSL